MIDLNFRMSRTEDVLDVANDRHSRYTDLENGAFQETPHAGYSVLPQPQGQAQLQVQGNVTVIYDKGLVQALEGHREHGHGDYDEEYGRRINVTYLIVKFLYNLLIFTLFVRKIPVVSTESRLGLDTRKID